MRPEKYSLQILFIATIMITGSCLEGQVKVWEEMLTLPTYEPLPADKNPMFYVPDAYQGAKRVLYPYPLKDNLSSEKSEREHKAVYLENEYIKLCLLPDIGGRLFYATDKTNNYEIFYRQHVIKPANIGMLGAWISGGIEWCVFHHHRATTHLPVDYRLVENDDGSKTIWFGEMEPFVAREVGSEPVLYVRNIMVFSIQIQMQQLLYEEQQRLREPGVESSALPGD